MALFNLCSFCLQGIKQIAVLAESEEEKRTWLENRLRVFLAQGQFIVFVDTRVSAVELAMNLGKAFSIEVCGVLI
jgi:hypothetical protein